jgi:CheY-like chemotaxis protein/DNA-binding CsgD family transcriptional regulator
LARFESRIQHLQRHAPDPTLSPLHHESSNPSAGKPPRENLLQLPGNSIRAETTGIVMKTVMAVDDIPANVDVLLGLLHESGYRVLVADSGCRGIEQLKRELPDLILLDLMMPGMDGIETCRRIKARDAWKHIPILMMTAADELSSKLAAFEAGAVDFLTKPIQPAEVLARLNIHLQIRELQSELESANCSLKQKNELLAEEIDLRLDAEKQLEASLEQAILISNREGEILFATRQAQLLLSTFFPSNEIHRLPPEVQTWLTAQNNRTPLRVIDKKRGEIEIAQFPIASSGNLSMMRIEHRNGDRGPRALLALGLTAREAEVLYWIAEGKTNPEIAIILESSVNTVKKRANNIFAKLGVETRTGAARAALLVLSPQN